MQTAGACQGRHHATAPTAHEGGASLDCVLRTRSG